MPEFLSSYLVFLLEGITVVVLIAIVIGLIVSTRKDKDEEKGRLFINLINDTFTKDKHKIADAILDKKQLKAIHKAEKQKKKQKKKEDNGKKRIFIIDFKGDIQANANKNLRNCVNALLTQADKNDEVLILLESGGGLVSNYGLAASQLKRIKDKNIPLTICIDKIAASGGYMMACVADRIISAPFAIVGSIGVIGQLPNFNKLLKKGNIDFEQHTSGKYKRSLTVFGENTDEGRQKFKEDLESIHGLFKDFIHQNRPQVDLDKVANGDYWFGTTALELKLVDELNTSDAYLMEQSDNALLVHLEYKNPKNLMHRLGATSQNLQKIIHGFKYQSHSPL